MTVADDLATLRWAIDEHPTLKASPTAVAALARVEAEIARLEGRIEVIREGMQRQQAATEARAEAAEAEVARLTHLIECADTPLMRDVLAEVARLRDGLRQAQECCARPPGTCFDPSLAEDGAA